MLSSAPPFVQASRRMNGGFSSIIKRELRVRAAEAERALDTSAVPKIGCLKITVLTLNPLLRKNEWVRIKEVQACVTGNSSSPKKSGKCTRKPDTKGSKSTDITRR